MITAACPSCGRRFELPDTAAGKRGKCPQCGDRVEIPGSPPGNANPPPPPPGSSATHTVSPAEVRTALSQAKGPPSRARNTSRGVRFLELGAGLAIGLLVGGLSGWAIRGPAEASDFHAVEEERDELAAQLADLRQASASPEDAQRLLADAQLRIRDLEGFLTEEKQRVASLRSLNERAAEAMEKTAANIEAGVAAARLGVSHAQVATAVGRVYTLEFMHEGEGRSTLFALRGGLDVLVECSGPQADADKVTVFGGLAKSNLATMGSVTNLVASELTDEETAAEIVRWVAGSLERVEVGYNVSTEQSNLRIEVSGVVIGDAAILMIQFRRP